MPTMTVMNTYGSGRTKSGGTWICCRHFRGTHRHQPGRLSYTAFQLDDKVSFVHIIETEHGAAPFAHMTAYQAFRATVGQRCNQPPP